MLFMLLTEMGKLLTKSSYVTATATIHKGAELQLRRRTKSSATATAV